MKPLAEQRQLYGVRVRQPLSTHWELNSGLFRHTLDTVGGNADLYLNTDENGLTGQHLMTNERSTNALDVAERHANGEATDDELYSAWDAAWDAARAAAAAPFCSRDVGASLAAAYPPSAPQNMIARFRRKFTASSPATRSRP